MAQRELEHQEGYLADLWHDILLGESVDVVDTRTMADYDLHQRFAGLCRRDIRRYQRLIDERNHRAP